MRKKVFALFDGRAKCGCSDDATQMDAEESEAEARRCGEMMWKGYDAVWYEYDVDERGYLVNERMRTDIPPYVLD